MANEVAPKLTPKQAKFVKEYTTNGGNAADAGRKAYPNQNEKSAAQQGWENLGKPEIAKAIRAEFEKQGITLEKIMKPIAKGLEAKDHDGQDDLQKQFGAHDRAMRALAFGDDKAVQMNFENVEGIKIMFSDFRKEDNGTSDSNG